MSTSNSEIMILPARWRQNQFLLVLFHSFQMSHQKAKIHSRLQTKRHLEGYSKLFVTSGSTEYLMLLHENEFQTCLHHLERMQLKEKLESCKKTLHTNRQIKQFLTHHSGIVQWLGQLALTQQARVRFPVTEINFMNRSYHVLFILCKVLVYSSSFVYLMAKNL